jgi:hypothetical protein
MIKEELTQVAKLMGNKWCKQNDLLDRKTKFIYDVMDFKTLQSMCNRMLSKEEDRLYAYHRWFNLNISTYCEEVFCKYGAVKVENKKDKEKDIYINDIPFDVKVTNYPSTASEEFDLDSEVGRKDLATWLYNNQSKEGRQHFKNRIFIVCCGDSLEEKVANRMNLELLDAHIKDFMSEPTNISLEEFKTVCGLIPIKSQF